MLTSLILSLHRSMTAKPAVTTAAAPLLGVGKSVVVHDVRDYACRVGIAGRVDEAARCASCRERVA